MPQQIYTIRTVKASSVRIFECHTVPGVKVLAHVMSEDMWLVRPGTSSATPTLTFDVSGHEERAGLGPTRLWLCKRSSLCYICTTVSRFRGTLCPELFSFSSIVFYSTLVLDAISSTLPATLH